LAFAAFVAGAFSSSEAASKRFTGNSDGRIRPVRPSTVAVCSAGCSCGLEVNTLAANSPSVDGVEIALEMNAPKTRLAAAKGVSAASSRTSLLGSSSGDGSSMTVLQFVFDAWSGLRLLFISTVNGRACDFIGALFGIEGGSRALRGG